jgi:hypothetical protein
LVWAVCGVAGGRGALDEVRRSINPLPKIDHGWNTYWSVTKHYAVRRGLDEFAT